MRRDGQSRRPGRAGEFRTTWRDNRPVPLRRPLRRDRGSDGGRVGWRGSTALILAEVPSTSDLETTGAEGVGLATDYGCTARPGEPILRARTTAWCCRRRRTAPLAETPCSPSRVVGPEPGAVPSTPPPGAPRIRPRRRRTRPARSRSFHAYDWTYSLGTADNDSKQTFLRNVFFRNASVPSVPIDSIDYPSSPHALGRARRSVQRQHGLRGAHDPATGTRATGSRSSRRHTATDRTRMTEVSAPGRAAPAQGEQRMLARHASTAEPRSPATSR